MQARSLIVLCVLCASGAEAQVLAGSTARYTVAGVVTDSMQTPLNDAEVRLLVSGSLVTIVRTNDGGRFTITGDMSAPSKLHVRRLGYQPLDVVLMFPRDSSRVLSLILDVMPVKLTEVEVLDRGADASGWLDEFFDRQRTNSFGHYYTHDALKARGVHYTSEVFRTLPGVRLIQARRGGYVIRIRNCDYAPLVWLDGMRIPQTELDEVVSLDDIAALEVYMSTAGVPARFMDRSNSGCGTIVVWTRHQ